MRDGSETFLPLPARKKLLKEWIDLTRKALDSLYLTEGVTDNKPIIKFIKSKKIVSEARFTKEQFLRELGKKLRD